MSRQGTAATADDRERLGQHRTAVLSGRMLARDLGHQVEARSHRDPDKDLGGHRGGAVGARQIGREPVLGGDDVDVLEHGDDPERRDRRPRLPHVGPQRDRRATPGLRRAEPAAQRHRAVEHHRDERQWGSDVRAGHSEADRREHAAEHEPGGLLADQADADRAIVAEALEEAAQDAQHQVEATGRDSECRSPVLLDPDGNGDRMPQQDREHRHHRREDQQPLHPVPDRRGHCRPDPEMAEHGLARGCQLHRIPDDREDQEVADEGGQRSVVAEQPGEHDHRTERDHVVGDHRASQTRRLGGIRAAEP